MTVADPIACAPIRLAARPPVRSQLGRLAQVDMFQLALRLRGIEVEQDADTARQPVGHGDFRGAEQRHVAPPERSEEHTSELQSLAYLVCRLLLEKKKCQPT